MSGAQEIPLSVNCHRLWKISLESNLCPMTTNIWGKHKHSGQLQNKELQWNLLFVSETIKYFSVQLWNCKLDTTMLLGIWYNCLKRKYAFKTTAIKERQLPVFFPELKRTLDVICKLSIYIYSLHEEQLICWITPEKAKHLGWGQASHQCKESKKLSLQNPCMDSGQLHTIPEHWLAANADEVWKNGSSCFRIHSSLC